MERSQVVGSKITRDQLTRFGGRDQVNQRRLLIVFALLFAACHLVVADEPQQLLSQFLDVQRPAEQRASALAGLMANQQGVGVLTDAVAARDGRVTKATSALFESEPPKLRALVMIAVAQTQDRDSYDVLNSKAFHDVDSQVKASAFGAAAVFADRSGEVIDVLVKEIQAAQLGPGLSAAAQFAGKFEVSEAIEPLLELLKNGSLGCRELAAQSLSAYSSLPENARPVLLSAVEAARKDAARLDAMYQFLPSAKNPSGSSPATNLQELLNRALGKMSGIQREESAPGKVSSPKSTSRAPAETALQTTVDPRPGGNANQDSSVKEIASERSHGTRRIWLWLVILGVVAAALLLWQLLSKSKSP